MEEDLIPIDDFFVSEAKGDQEFLDEILLEAMEQLKEGDNKTCCGMLRTYILGSEMLMEVADFLNCSEEELLQRLDRRAIDKKEHLEKIIEFLQINME